jgi:DNA-binding NtrC family response regulator
MPPHERGVIGVIEDDPMMGGTLAHRLELEGYKPLWWRTGQEALQHLCAAQPDLVVSDIRLPDMSGEDVFLRVLPQLGGKPFVFVTAFGQIEQAVRLTKAGALDYIAKPYALPDLLERIARLIALQSRAIGALGASEAMRQVEMLLRRVANIDSSLLFTGESGVGKEVVAQFVHQISTRAQDPFQLLRLMQERAFTRVGGEATIKTSARIICATNADLEHAVAEGRFRSDLYYRINVISVAIPPLRDRFDDILPLAHMFMREFSEMFVRDVHSFTPAAEQALLEHPWRGNVRELRNRIERAVALSQAPGIGVEALFPLDAPKPIAAENSFRTLAEIRYRAERHHIRAVLTSAGGRVEEAAKLLGVSRSTLFEKMRKLGLRSGI